MSERLYERIEEELPWFATHQSRDASGLVEFTQLITPEWNVDLSIAEFAGELTVELDGCELMFALESLNGEFEVMELLRALCLYGFAGSHQSWPAYRRVTLGSASGRVLGSSGFRLPWVALQVVEYAPHLDGPRSGDQA